MKPPAAELSGLESEAWPWIGDFDLTEHMRRALDWVVALRPDASPAMRLAALTHDIERRYPGGPTPNLANHRWDDAQYLFAHSPRSAEIVSWWLRDHLADPALVEDVRQLILRHELGGDPAADVVQAADSLSRVEINAQLARQWVDDGVCDASQAAGKLQFMFARIRPVDAHQVAEPLLAGALSIVLS